MTLNEIIVGDALEQLRELPADTFAAVITSPPYNLGDKNLPGKSKRGGVLQPGHNPVEYAGGFEDCLDLGAYAHYHRWVMSELLRVLRSDGLLWYVHRRRPIFDPDGLPSLAEQVLAGFPVRSEIIWHKGPGLNHCTAGAGGGYYYPVPSYEVVHLLARGKAALLNRDIAKYGDVWQFPRERNPHPAPFPQALAARCIAATLAAGPVLDPFIGSGTTALAAQAAGREWLGIEQAAEYVQMARERLNRAAANPELLR